MIDRVVASVVLPKANVTSCRRLRTNELAARIIVLDYKTVVAISSINDT
jgi:hypothetical protein